MKRSHTKAAPKHGLVQRSYSSQNSRELNSDDMDKIKAKYDKDRNNKAPQFHLLFGQKPKYKKFSRQISKSPNNRTYYSRALGKFRYV